MSNQTASIDEDKALLQEISSKSYKNQAIWFLNAFWKDYFENKECEQELVWRAKVVISELDLQNGDNGCFIDQLTSHRLLEKIDDALTVHELLEWKDKIDLNRKTMSLVEFLVFRYKACWRQMVHAPQGDIDEAKLAMAEAKCKESKEAIDRAEKAADEARLALSRSLKAEESAKSLAASASKAKSESEASEATARKLESAAVQSEGVAVKEEKIAVDNESLAIKAESIARTAMEEQTRIQTQVRAAMAEVECEQNAFKAECDKLEATGNNQSLGIVKRNTALAQLAQLRCTDPLPLQRALVSHKSAVRRQEHATQAACDAELQAKEARKLAEKTRANAVSKRKAAEEHRRKATAALREAEKHRAQAVVAHEKAEEGKRVAEKARKASEKSKAESDQAVIDSVDAYKAAENFLNQVKKECSGAGKGKLWWMGRELEESKKYMSQAQLARLAA